MKHYLVITPEYGEVDPVLDYGQGPIEYGCDVIEVEAQTKREARDLGVYEMLRNKDYQYCRDSRDGGENPFTGITVEVVDDDEAIHE